MPKSDWCYMHMEKFGWLFVFSSLTGRAQLLKGDLTACKLTGHTIIWPLWSRPCRRPCMDIPNFSLPGNFNDHLTAKAKCVNGNPPVPEREVWDFCCQNVMTEMQKDYSKYWSKYERRSERKKEYQASTWMTPYGNAVPAGHTVIILQINSRGEGTGISHVGKEQQASPPW